MKNKIDVAVGNRKADLVLKNCSYLCVFTNEVLRGDIAISDGYFVGIGDYSGEKELDLSGKTVIPSFIDGHIHLESSLISPAEFARAVVPHGTTGVVADPHEIANVAGTDGLDYMMKATAGLPIDVYMMLPSCVPATEEDENGARLTHHELVPYLREKRVLGLGEVMDAHSVVERNEEAMNKIDATLAYGKRVDGHAPMLRGKELNAYINAGVTSDHECITEEEALEKLRKGMWVMIREGTAAKNLDALIRLFEEQYHFRCMLVSDDKHSEDIQKLGHLDYVVREAIRLGADPKRAIRMASFNAAKYYRLGEIGAIGVGYRADFIVTTDIEKLDICAVYRGGNRIYDKQDGVVPFETPAIDRKLDKRVRSTFNVRELVPEDFAIPEENQYSVIELIPGQIYTKKSIRSDVSGCARLAVIERHKGTGHIGTCYLDGYGIKSGAIATSIAHDSHNLIVVGVDPVDMAIAANCVRKNEGGMATAVGGKVIGELPLPIAGLMSDKNIDEVDTTLEKLKSQARKMGVREGIDPFMTLSFVCLTVLPEIRLTTTGIVDVI